MGLFEDLAAVGEIPAAAAGGRWRPVLRLDVVLSGIAVLTAMMIVLTL